LTSAIIEITGAVKHFGEVRAVDGVDLGIRAGEIFGLIGHNGAGKSTLFKTMLGLLPLTAGSIRIDGQAVRGRDFREVRRRIGYLPENVVFYDNLSGLETLAFFARLKGVAAGACAGLLEKVGLGHAARRRVRGYSKGMRQRLGLAQALLGDPAILFLDEPTTGLDPEAIREFYVLVGELRDRGATVVLTSHILAEIQARVDRLAIMKSGRIQATGTLSGLREAMDLPLVFHVTLRPGAAGALREALAPLGLPEVQGEGDRLVVRVARADKMAVLGVLARLNDRVVDIHVHEPSLEDVFLGYAA